MKLERTGNMGNKLKSVFSTEMFELGGSIRFKDIESSRKFSEALNLLYDEGNPVEIDGVESVSIRIKDGGVVYPPSVHEHIEKCVIFPSKEPIPIEIETVSGKKMVTLYRYQTKREVIIETATDAVVYLKLSARKDNPTFHFIYRMQLDKAMRIKDIAEGIYDAIGIVKMFFGSTDAQNINEGKAEYINMIRSFQFTGKYFDKLCALENKLNIAFDPQKIENIDESASDVYELYLLLIEKKPIRLNARLTTTTATGITIADDTFEHKLGAPLELIFDGEAAYEICGQTIRLHTANLLTNAIVKAIETDSTGMTHISYGDTDSNPMYISYRGFIRKSDATNERKRIMTHKKKYEDAKTVEKYIAECSQ